MIAIRRAIEQKNITDFESAITNLAVYLGYETRRDHICKLYSTVIDSRYHVAFDPDRYQNIAITFHSSKGLEFDQVILFAEDYNLGDVSSVYNHYVAVTRAKNRVIIVKMNTYYANCFQQNLARIFSASNKQISDLVTYK